MRWDICKYHKKGVCFYLTSERCKYSSPSPYMKNGWNELRTGTNFAKYPQNIIIRDFSIKSATLVKVPIHHLDIFFMSLEDVINWERFEILAIYPKALIKKKKNNPSLLMTYSEDCT